MPVIYRPAVAQPPVGCVVNWANPITRGLVGAYPDCFYNAVRGTYATKQGTTLRSTRATAFGGRSCDNWSTTNYLIDNNMPYPGNNFTVMALAKFDASNTHAAVCSYEDSGGLTGWIIGTGGADATGFQLSQGTAGGGQSFNKTGAFPTAGSYTIALTQSGTNATFYVNGEQFATQTTAAMITSSQPLSIGQDAGLNDNFFSPITAILLWNRVLTAAEVLDLYRRPWQVYLAPVQQAVRGPAGINVTITPSTA